MAAVLNNTFCSACQGRHKLCFPDEDLLYGNRQYEYE